MTQVDDLLDTCFKLRQEIKLDHERAGALLAELAIVKQKLDAIQSVLEHGKPGDRLPAIERIVYTDEHGEFHG